MRNIVPTFPDINQSMYWGEIRARYKDLKVGGHVPAQNEIWKVTLVT